MIDLPQPPLISADQLLPLLGEPSLKLFDVRGGWGSDGKTALSGFRASHIPGAYFIDWRRQFIELGVETHLASVASKAEARASFSELGINEGDAVVLYDDYHHMQAGRIWWAMQYWGFTNVRVLDGGLEHWRACGYEESNEHSSNGTGNFQPIQMASRRVSLKWLNERLGKIDLVDARGPVGYGGNIEDPRTGHIPTAINVPFSIFLDEETGLFKSNESIEMLLNERIRNFNKRVIVSSCGSGYAGTVALLAMRKIGVQAPLFDGSFAKWKQDADRPIEQGPYHNV